MAKDLITWLAQPATTAWLGELLAYVIVVGAALAIVIVAAVQIAVSATSTGGRGARCTRTTIVEGKAQVRRAG